MVTICSLLQLVLISLKFIYGKLAIFDLVTITIHDDAMQGTLKEMSINVNGNEDILNVVNHAKELCHLWWGRKIDGQRRED